MKALGLQAFHEELWQAALAETIRAYCLFAFCAIINNLHFAIVILFDNGIYTSPAEVSVVKVNNVANC